MPDENQPNLITPEGIHYECTGCGKCCSGWSVPLTEDDYKRVAGIDWGGLDPGLKGKKLFRELRPEQARNTPYKYAINATPEGQCPFLKNNLCFIHSQFNAKTKPAMCQLFPYSFNETPSGVYTSVSFVSRGAIFNAGKALSDQKEYLLSKYKDFKSLFVDYLPNWSQIKLSANIPLSWDEYLNIENQLLVHLQDKTKSLAQRFIDGSFYLQRVLNEKTKTSLNPNPAGSAAEKQPLNFIDKIVLSLLYKTYFPGKTNRPQGYGNLMLSTGTILFNSINTALTESLPQSPSKDLYYCGGTFSYALANQLITLAWPDDNLEISDILYRFFYSHIFGKHYFGASLGQLSLIAGFHQQALLLALIKLHARRLAINNLGSQITLTDIEQTIVQLEKSFGELKFTNYGTALLEILLASPGRIARILHFTR